MLFLGSEKYDSVLNSIYAGLGVPPTLTGLAGNGGGFTNNFISLKTLVERLQYGRNRLTSFWQQEMEKVRKAMGFRRPAYVQFDQMNLSDDTAEKNLLLQLADRDIISHETILERFKEIPTVEKIRLKRELKERDASGTPDKASPFHNANHKKDLEKMDRQSELNEKSEKNKENKENKGQPNAPKPPSKEGRPLLKRDDKPRKKRVEKPKSKPGLAELITWSQNSYDKISESVTTAFLKMNNKKNLRQMTKSEMFDVERIKFDVLTNISLLSEVSDAAIHASLAAGKVAPKAFKETLRDKNIVIEDMAIDNFRQQAISCYVEFSIK